MLLSRFSRIATESLREGEERLHIVNTRRAQLDRQLTELHSSKRQCDVGYGFSHDLEQRYSASTTDKVLPPPL
jgi:hypothetical protein